MADQSNGGTSNDHVEQITHALRAAIESQAGAQATAANAPAMGATAASLPLKCIVSAAVKYGTCRLTGGTSCELTLVSDIVACFK